MTFPPEATLGEVGEFGLIDALTPLFAGEDAQVLVGPGDDAAVLRVKTGHVVMSTDLMVEGRHFRRDWCSGEDVGHRAAAQNLSDINAMGGRARWLTIGLAAPAGLPASWAVDFARGFGDRMAVDPTDPNFDWNAAADYVPMDDQHFLDTDRYGHSGKQGHGARKKPAETAPNY